MKNEIYTSTSELSRSVLKNVVIFDLDGCLSDDRARLPLLAKDYDAYHRNAIQDPLINGDVFEEHRAAGHSIVFITARPRRYANATLDWLRMHFGEVDRFSLLMREPDDVRSSPEVKVWLFDAVARLQWRNVIAAYDDREDVLAAYREKGVENCRLLVPPVIPEDNAVMTPRVDNVGVPEILRGMAETYEERTARYGGRWKMVPEVMSVLFPDGVSPEMLAREEFHLFVSVVTKVIRFATSDLHHADSIHDAAVYSAIIESIISKGEEPGG